MTPCGRGGEAALFLVLLLAMAPAAAAVSWRVVVRGTDVTRSAAPLQARQVVLVDVAALAPALGLVVHAAGGAVSVRDREGRIWRGTVGDSRLRTSGEELLLESPLRVDSRSVYLPVACLAELAGLSLFLDPAAGRIELLAVEAGETAGDGWQALVIDRPHASEVPGGEGGEPLPSALVLPPVRESLRLEMAVGHVLGADWGGELTAAGSVRGWEARMFSLLTNGPAGFQAASGQAALINPETGRGGEVGDLFSEIWGSAQGARLVWRRGSEAESRARPALSLYLPDETGGRGDALLAYRDDIALGRSAGLTGELATDGSWLLRGGWNRGGLGLFGFWREDSGGASRGVSGALDLPRGTALQGSWSRSGAGESGLELATLSLRMPLFRSADLAVESTSLESSFSRARSAALLLGAPLGPARLRVRWQRRLSEGVALHGRPPVRHEQDELLATAALAAGPQLGFELQSVSRWDGADSAKPWQQLVISWRPARQTTLQVWALSSGAPLDDPLRVRLAQELPQGYSLLAEYGRIPSFQEGDGGGDESPRYKLLIRRSWQIGTPAGGGLVEGRVASPSGPPPAGMPVELGPYRTLTAADGRYAFRNVPRGRYTARIPEDALPASWAARGARDVEVRGRGRAELDLELVPLGHVRGRVWEDRDGDGRPAPEEGVAGAVVRLGESATRTDEKGHFGFFNLPPGSFRLEVDPDRLPAGFIPAVPSRIDLGLPPGGSLDDVGLRVVRRRRPVVYQELP